MSGATYKSEILSEPPPWTSTSPSRGHTSTGMLSSMASLLSNPFLWESLKLFFFGTIIETGRRIFRWAITRFRRRFSVRAEFGAGDPVYEWLLLFLAQENVWGQSRDFLVEAKTSKWRRTLDPCAAENEHVDVVPEYGSQHFFRWKGYWIELNSPQGPRSFIDVDNYGDGGSRGTTGTSLFLTLYTLEMSVLFAFIEECRLRYVENCKRLVVIHTRFLLTDYGRDGHWDGMKRKRRRPLESLVLDDGILDSLVKDAREFLDVEDWYVKSGIPHRRGYLLHGPPGTGKTTTVYAVAGELGLDIYSLSLASANIDDIHLAVAVSKLPSRGILLIEDIDCAFPSRDDGEHSDHINRSYDPWRNHHSTMQRSQVTLSGLLNVLDGIGSEEGKLFFATTNHIDRLDPALLRPGRIDRKIEYKLASRKQARALFYRFFPASRYSDLSNVEREEASKDTSPLNLGDLADEFALAIPENELSTAELQGYLLEWKLKPLDAAREAKIWVEREREEKLARERREDTQNETAEATARQGNVTLLPGYRAAVPVHGQMFGQDPYRQYPHHRYGWYPNFPPMEDCQNGATDSQLHSASPKGDAGDGRTGSIRSATISIPNSPQESPLLSTVLPA